MMRRVCPIVIALCGWLTVPAARADFGAPVEVADTPAVFALPTSAPDGRAAIAWVGQASDGGADGVRLIVRRAAEAPFGPVLHVAEGQAGDAAVAASSGGAVVVVWEGYGGGLSLRRWNGVALEPIQTLVPAGRAVALPKATIDDAGNAAIAWVSAAQAGDPEAKVFTAWVPAGQAPQAPQLVSSSVSVSDATITTLGNGRAAVGFSAADSQTSYGPPHLAFVSLLRLGQPPGAPQRLSRIAVPAGMTESTPRFSRSGDHVVASWERFVAGPAASGLEIHVANLDPADVSASHEVTLTPGGLTTGDDVAVNKSGRILAAWLDPAGGIISGMVGDQVDRLSSPFNVNTVEHEGVPFQVGLDTAGSGVLLWRHTLRPPTINDSGASEIRAATVPAGRAEACAPERVMSGKIGQPAVAFDDVGGGFATWSTGGGPVYVADWHARSSTCGSGGGQPPSPGTTQLKVLAPAALSTRTAKPTVRIKVRCRLKHACEGPATLASSKTALATGRLRLAAGKSGTLQLKPLSAQARTALRRKGTRKLALRVRLKVPGRPSQALSIPVTLNVR